MATVLREPEQQTSDGGTPPPGSPEAAPPPGGAPFARTCRACGAGLLADQDWCLECGTARPGRLGTRPGWRAASGVSAATLALVCGAVAASYAAITDDAGRSAATPAGQSATPIAQAPPAIAPPVTTTPGPLTPVTPGATTTTAKPTTPGLPTPGAVNIPSGTATPGATGGSPIVPGAGTPATTGSTPAGGTGSTPGTTTSTTTTQPRTLQPVAIPEDAADLYDPYERATAKGTPDNAYASDAKDPFFVTTATDGKPMQVGLLVDLGARRTVRRIEFATTTPGFRVEVYSTDGSALPPDILDTRWAHIGSRSDVDKSAKHGNTADDGKEIIGISANAPQVRKLVLWFTTPPGAGATVKLKDLVLKG